MSMVCPRCSKSFDDRMLCPTCNVRLLPSGSTVYEIGPSAAPSDAKWQQTYLGRGVVGLMLAQGLYYGLWQLSTAVVMAVSDFPNPIDWWQTTPGWSLLLILQGASLLVSGALAGAGQRLGAMIGLGLGLVNSLLWLLLVKVGIGQLMTPAELIGQPLLQIVCAGVGGYLGSSFWKPIVTIGRRSRPGSSIRMMGPIPYPRATRLINTFRGPISWFKVGTGTFIGIAGSLWANLILVYILNTGHVSVESTRHALFVTWEISVLMMLLGGAVAGANCRNGSKQGLIVGLACSFALLGVLVQGGLVFVPQNLMYQSPALMHLTIDWLPGKAPDVLFTFLSVLPLATIGGWFGGQLLPPLLQRPKGPKQTFPVGA